jgi:hypothetical protein
VKRGTIDERIADELKAQGFAGVAFGDHRLIFHVAHDAGIAPKREDEDPFSYVKRILAAIDRCDSLREALLSRAFWASHQTRLIRSYRLKDADENLWPFLVHIRRT